MHCAWLPTSVARNTRQPLPAAALCRLACPIVSHPLGLLLPRLPPPPSISPGQDAVDALADAALAARTRFEPRELAHMLWNMSRLGYVDDPFFMAFVPGAPCGV